MKNADGAAVGVYRRLGHRFLCYFLCPPVCSPKESSGGKFAAALFVRSRRVRSGPFSCPVLQPPVAFLAAFVEGRGDAGEQLPVLRAVVVLTAAAPSAQMRWQIEIYILFFSCAAGRYAGRIQTLFHCMMILRVMEWVHILYAYIRLRISGILLFTNAMMRSWYSVSALHAPRLCTTLSFERATSTVSMRLPSRVADKTSESGFR